MTLRALLVSAAMLLGPLAQASEHSITLTAVGDTMPGSSYPTPLLPEHCSDLFAGVRPWLGKADITFANLEGAVTDNTADAKTCTEGCFFFAMPPSTAQCVKDAGFDVVSVANNHANDFGPAGRRDTAAHLTRAGLPFAGQDNCEATILERKGLKIGILAFAPHSGSCPMNDMANAERLVSELRRKVNITVVSMHAGAEGMKALHLPQGREFFLGQDRGDLRTFARRVIDAGADMVIGHGPHVPRAMQLYKGRLIAYSLGNFTTWQRFNLREANGLTPVLTVELGRDGRFLNGRIDSAFQTKQTGPQPDPEQRAARMIHELSDSDIPEHGLWFGDNGELKPARQLTEQR